MATLDSVNEKTTSYITASFKDKTGLPAAPASANYQIHDAATGAEIKATTALTPATDIEITIAPSENAVLNSSLAVEKHVLTVVGTYGASDAVTGRFYFNVRNLKHVP